MREYLQAYILKIMQDSGFFRKTAFVGGTALRFLYDLPRFSEDLDFSLVKKDNFNFIAVIKKIKEELILAGYDNIEISYNDKKTVNHAFIKFSDLLYEAGITAMRSQKLSIKIEIDTNPPKGADLETSIVNRYFIFSFLTYDVPSLFAGKLHALFNRKYTKGRDYFDIGWYLSKWKGLSPNIILLQNALTQTDWKGVIPEEDNWKELLCKTIEETNWKKVLQDVENFLENSKDKNIFTKENILHLLKL